MLSAIRLTTALLGLTLLVNSISAEPYKIAPETSKALEKIAAGDQAPIEIEAFLSPAVPREYVQTVKNVRHVLAGFDAAGGDKIQVNVKNVKPYSPEAQEIFKQYEISPQLVSQGIPGVSFDRFVHAHIRVKQGEKTVEVPFQGPFSATELQLRLAIDEITGAPQQKVAVVKTGLVDTMLNDTKPSPVLELLEAVYTVDYVSLTTTKDAAAGDEDATEEEAATEKEDEAEDEKEEAAEAKEAVTAASLDCDVLLVLQPSTLSSEDIAALVQIVKDGKPTAIFEDPAPRLWQRVNTTAKPEDLQPLWAALGVEFNAEKVAWQVHRPATLLDTTAKFPVEMMFFDRKMNASGDKTWDGLSSTDPALQALNHLAFFYAGSITAKKDANLAFTPLATTTDQSGLTSPAPLPPSAPDGSHPPFDENKYVVAARVAAKENKGVSAVVVADIDCVSATLFNRNPQTQRNLPLENPLMMLNLLDSLAGDSRYLSVRSRVAGFPPLTAEEKQLIKKSDAVAKKAQAEIQKIQAAAQEGMKAEVDKIRKDIAAGGNPVAAQQKFRMLQATAQREMQEKVQKAEDAAREELKKLQDQVRNNARPLISTLID